MNSRSLLYYQVKQRGKKKREKIGAKLEERARRERQAVRKRGPSSRVPTPLNVSICNK